MWLWQISYHSHKLQHCSIRNTDTELININSYQYQTFKTSVTQVTSLKTYKEIVRLLAYTLFLRPNDKRSQDLNAML